MPLVPMIWKGKHLSMLDQRLLPTREVWLNLTTHEQVAEAIRDMAVRGAPAIGVAAAYGMALAAMEGSELRLAHKLLADSRPTAVNLFWALDRIESLEDHSFESILSEAQAIEREDLAMNLAIGEHGASLIPQGARILTVCNTGALATAGHGTALGIVRTAHAQGKEIHVYSCETRPRQQGLRLTAYELMQEQIPFHSIADGMAGSLMRSGKIDCVIVGADRIASNGDTANKIGTYSLAVLANYHQVPFYVAVPSSTFDSTLPNGDLIPIEERSGDELTHIEGIQIGPSGCPVYNPGFDITPGDLIDRIITEQGIHRSPYSF